MDRGTEREDGSCVMDRRESYGPGDRVIVKAGHAHDHHGVVIAAAPDRYQREMGWTVAVKLDRKYQGSEVMLFAPETLVPEEPTSA